MRLKEIEAVVVRNLILSVGYKRIFLRITFKSNVKFG